MALVALASPVFVTFLITRVSGIPLLEATNDKKYEGNEDYSEYKRLTPILAPNFLGFYQPPPRVPKKDQ
jgi:steroid 5-alpha reductase family enzyme